MQNQRILISGAGVAGLTLAFWLRKYGFTPTLIERNPMLRKGGYKIDIRGVAIEVVKEMGLYDKILNEHTEIRGATFIDHEGKEITEMHGDLYGLRVGEDVEIMRGDLCQILASSVEGIETIYDDEILHIGEPCDVTCKKSKTRSFDLVIGADGLHSRVRKLTFGEEKDFIKPLGLYISIFSIPNFLELDRWEMEYQEAKRFLNVFSIKGEEAAKAAFVFLSKEEMGKISNPQELLQEEFSHAGWKVGEILSHMKNAPDFYFDVVAQIHMPKWSQGRIALLGDAAYSASPMSGQGTSLALVGAYVLAKELYLAQGDYKTAFEKYEKNLRSFVKKNQQLAIHSVQAVTGMGKSYLPRWLFKYWLEWSQKNTLKRIHKAANAYPLRRKT